MRGHGAAVHGRGGDVGDAAAAGHFGGDDRVEGQIGVRIGGIDGEETLQRVSALEVDAEIALPEDPFRVTRLRHDELPAEHCALSRLQAIGPAEDLIAPRRILALPPQPGDRDDLPRGVADVQRLVRDRDEC